MWTTISSSPEEEETISNGFYTNTLFEVTNDEKVTFNPSIKSFISNNCIILSIDNNLILIYNENISERTLLNFESRIDAICLSSSGDLIVIALNNGNIHGIYLKKSVQVFNLSVDIKENDTFLDIQQINNDYYIVCTSGTFYRLYNVNESELFDLTFDQSFNDTVLNNAGIEQIFTQKSYNTSTFCCMRMQSSKDLMIISGKLNFLYFQSGTVYSKLKLPRQLGNIKHLLDLNNVILGLSDTGYLFDICPYSKMIFLPKIKLDYLIEDITAIEKNDSCIELLVLTKPDSMGNRRLKIVKYLKMECIFDLTVPNNTWLVRQNKSVVNTYCIVGNQLDTEFIQKIEMNVISETSPVDRLKKLIYRGRLDEAEAFATQFNLSLQPIYEAKARHLLNNISCTDEKDIPILLEQFENLQKLSKMINNSEFLLTLRNIEIYDYNIKKRFLTFLKENVNFDEYQNEENEIEDQLQRLNTLELIYPHMNSEWQKFLQNTDLTNIVLNMLSKDIDVACIIWRHHLSSIIPFINVKIISNLLSAVPSTTKPFYIIQLLKHILPTILQTHPESMTLCVDWSIEKTRSLQYSDQWPELGFEFCSNIFTIFYETTYLFSHAERHLNANINKLQLIINALESLTILKANFNITLTLDDYITDSIDDTAFQILQRVSLNFLSKIVKDFLYPLFIKNGLTPINSIKRYIQFLVNSRNVINTWQERAVILIDELYNEEDKLRCAVSVLKSSDVPWSDTLNSLLLYNSSNHPIAEEIRTEYELQTIKIMKRKYGWSVDGDTFKLGCRIIKQNLPEMLDDIRELIKIEPNQANNISFCCLLQLLNRGDIDVALCFINSLDDDLFKKTCSRVLNSAIQLIDYSEENQQKIANLIEFLSNIKSKMNIEDNNLLTMVFHVQTLKKDFDIKEIKSSDIRNPIFKVKYAQQGILSIVGKIKAYSPCLMNKIWNDILTLSKALDVDIVFLALKLLLEIKNIHFSCAISKLILDWHLIDKHNVDYIIDLTLILIVQQMNAVDDDGENPMAYPIAYNLLHKSLEYSNTYYMEVKEFLAWLRIGCSAYSLKSVEEYFNQNDYLTDEIVNKLFKQMNVQSVNTSKKRNSLDIFEEVNSKNKILKIQNNPVPILKCISLALKCLCSEDGNVLWNRLRQNVGDVNFTETKMEFIHSLNFLMDTKQYMTVFNIVQYILKHQIHMNICILPIDFARSLLKKILKYELKQKHSNFIVAYTILTSDNDPDELLEIIDNEIKIKEMKINLLNLREIYNSFRENGSIDQNKDRESRLEYYYCTELSKCNPILKTQSNISFMSLDHLLNGLQNKVLDVTFLEKLSQDFNWDYQEVLISQIITILNMQQLEVDIKADIFGKEEIIVKTSMEKIKILCTPYLNEITNVTLLVSRLEEFMDSINFYFYELYLCILDILQDFDRIPQNKIYWKSILLFLKHKMTSKRKNRIGQTETDWWLKSQMEPGVLPKISKYRFPFKLIVQESLENILDNEVSIDNCHQWFPLIRLHASMYGNNKESEILSLQDRFCMTAVKNSISEYKNIDSNEKEQWHLQPINNRFLQSILYLIKHMNDPAKILFILYFVTNQAPEGADQVEAAQECYGFTLENKFNLNQNKKALETINKIKRKYPIIKTQHMLHLYGLDNENLFKFVENPIELIEKLYLHELVLSLQKPDINKVAEEIANLHEIKFIEIQIQIIKKLLNCSVDNGNETVDFDETHTDFNRTILSEEFIDDESITRAHYILSSWDKEEAIEFLLVQLYNASRPSNISTKLQIFECLLRLIDNASYMEFINQQQYINLKILYYLNKFGFNLTTEKFENYDKLNIVKNIWKSYADNPKALELISLICIEYNIFLPQLWNGVLKKMVSLNMVKQISPLIEILSTKPNLLHIDGLTMAWEYVIKYSFQNVNKTKSFEQEMLLSKSTFMLQSCPVVSRMNLIELSEYFVQLDRYNMAAIIIAFAKGEQKKKIIETIRRNNYKNLKEDIIDLEKFGIYPLATKNVNKDLNL